MRTELRSVQEFLQEYEVSKNKEIEAILKKKEEGKKREEEEMWRIKEKNSDRYLKLVSSMISELKLNFCTTSKINDKLNRNEKVFELCSIF